MDAAARGEGIYGTGLNAMTSESEFEPLNLSQDPGIVDQEKKQK